MKVELSAEAQAQVEKIDSWWRRHRQLSPDLFTQELEGAFRALGEVPTLGVRYEAGRPSVRRLLLRRSHYHLYFVQERDDRLYIVAVWSAFRGRGPKL